MHLFVTLAGVCVVDVDLVNPEGVAQYKPVLVAGYRGERAAPPLEVRLVADAAQLAAHSTGTMGRMSLMKVTQTGSTFRQCSRMALVREVSLPPQRRVSSTASQCSRNSSAGRPATSAPKGFAFPIWICPIRLNARPEGLSPNKDPGWPSGKFTVWLGRT